MNFYDRILTWILRLSTVFLALSIPTIFMPEAWMSATHQWLGLGEMPRAPIVIYMARSLSAMYATLGGFTAILSTDVRRYEPIVTLWSWMHIIFGALIIGIDAQAGLPLHWTLTEGPPLIAVGLLCLWLQRKSATINS
jgi:hypothetical protein